MTKRETGNGKRATWIDTHCHLQLAAEAPGLLLERAAVAGVAWVVAPGTDLATSEASQRLAADHPGIVLATAGLHPHQAESWPAERDALESLAAASVAVGECGLDFYRNLAPREAQVVAFADQVRLAASLGLPVIVHCRDAFEDVHAILGASGWGHRAVLHCWTGGPRWTKRFLELGVTFSFAGPVTFTTGDTVRRGAAVVPMDRVMVETDTPYLTPPPDRHLPNEPANVVSVGRALATVWGVDETVVAAATSVTAARVFQHV
jgi:TatD DNase family protein